MFFVAPFPGYVTKAIQDGNGVKIYAVYRRRQSDNVLGTITT